MSRDTGCINPHLYGSTSKWLIAVTQIEHLTLESPLSPVLEVERAEASSPLLDVDYTEEGRFDFEDYGMKLESIRER
jgi:hypothetical protein